MQEALGVYGFWDFIEFPILIGFCLFLCFVVYINFQEAVMGKGGDGKKIDLWERWKAAGICLVIVCIVLPGAIALEKWGIDNRNAKHGVGVEQKQTDSAKAGSKSKKENDAEKVAESFTKAFLSNDVEGVRKTSIFEKRIYTNISMKECVDQFSHLVAGSFDLYAKSKGLNSNIQYGITSLRKVDDTHMQFNMVFKSADQTMTFYDITERKTKDGWKVDFESFLTSFMQTTGQM